MNHKPAPKYLQLKQEIMTWIQSGKLPEGHVLPSENTIAVQFQLSRHTVRQTFAQLEQEGWIERKHGKGTYVTYPHHHHSVFQKVRTIGMLTTSISDYIFPNIVRGAEAALRNRGYQLLLSSTDNDKDKEREAIHMMSTQAIQGLIIEPTKSAEGNPNYAFFQLLHKKNIPFLMINEKYPELDCPFIKVDDEKGGFLATEYLIQLGHTEIAGFFKTDDLQGLHRLDGFIRAHRLYGLNHESINIVRYTTEQKWTKPYQQAKRMLQRTLKRPTAFVCYNDELAVHLLEIVRQLGVSIPQDLSMIGFDDSALATATEVKLSTLTHPKSELGREAAIMLMDWIEGSNKDFSHQQVIYTPKLMIRESTRSLL